MTEPESLNVVIIDGYVDEPAHFGVPPYLSTYPRYVAGALVAAGVNRQRILYHTIDALREDRSRWRDVEDADLLIYVGGMTVPGKYLGGTPAEPDEVQRLAWINRGVSVLGGPVRFGVGERNEGAMETERRDLDFDFVAKGDIEAAVYDLVSTDLSEFGDRMRTTDEVTKWARDGAFIVEQHPNHPDHLICEMETARGCPYRCSFCTEPLYGQPTFRPVSSIVAEVERLAEHGIRHFRLGRQADLLAYGGDNEKPHPPALEALYSGIHSVTPRLKTLHLDNINPITIVRWPDLAREGLAIIAHYNTPGDTAAFGLESADPVVQEANNLNVSAEECFEAVKIVNEVGGHQQSDDHRGLPKLLPGINFVHGLAEERSETYEHNFAFLERILDSGLMVRRINIRQVMAFAGTDMSSTGAAIAHENKDLFRQYKQQVRESIDRPMLKRVIPTGTILGDVHVETHRNGTSFGRQLGTYPILVGIPGERRIGAVYDIMVTDHGFRSVTGIPVPIDPNRTSLEELQTLPGIGKRRAGEITINRPYRSIDDLNEVLDDPTIRQWFTIEVDG